MLVLFFIGVVSCVLYGGFDGIPRESNLRKNLLNQVNCIAYQQQKKEKTNDKIN